MSLQSNKIPPHHPASVPFLCVQSTLLTLLVHFVLLGYIVFFSSVDCDFFEERDYLFVDLAVSMKNPFSCK